jgi:hypothetical protein
MQGVALVAVAYYHGGRGQWDFMDEVKTPTLRKTRWIRLSSPRAGRVPENSKACPAVDVECSRPTMRHVRQFALMFSIMVCCVSSVGQEFSTTAIANLSRNPRKFDGRLVRIRAWVLIGWEGDNFLSEFADPASLSTPSDRPTSVWFYCKPDHDGKVCDTSRYMGRHVVATFTGYFRFVPNQKSRMKDVFDPGPLQLEVIGISDLRPNPDLRLPVPSR